MAADALAAFEGPLVLFAGEGRGGANGTAAFFDALDRDFYCERVVALDPFPGGFEKLRVLRRKPWWRRGRTRGGG